MKDITKYFDIIFFAKLISLVLVLYYFTIMYNGLVSPEGGYYSSFLDHNLNYIGWIRYYNIYVANLISNYFGTQSYIAGSQMLKIGSDTEIEVWLPCLGFGIMSFWISFVVNNSGTWQKKIVWIIGGIFTIWFINCWRIALLVISIDKNWKQNTLIDHHGMFNIASYSCILFMMYLYAKKKKSSDSSLEISKENLIQAFSKN